MPPVKRPFADEVLRARAEGRTYTGEQLLERANQLEGKVAQLRNRYEQYFIGLERKPPSTERDGLHKELDTLRQLSTKNTALKFKLNSLFNRFLTYERLWLRTEREIEEGRYHRDLFKARMHQQRTAAKAPGAVHALDDEAVEVTDFDDITEGDAPLPPEIAALRTAAPQPAPKAAPPPVARPAPVAASGRTLDDNRLRSIYDAYVSAKRECREPTDGLTFEQVASRIRAQVPEILKQTKAGSVDFKVVIKDGKAVLRAVTKD